MDQIKIGKFIAECRKSKNLTQEQLAEKLNITKNAVSKWERGISFPDVSLYKKICSELDISIEELINGERGSSLEAKDKAIIKTVLMKNKIKKKFIILFFIFFIIILCLVLYGVVFYKSDEDRLDEYYKRNLEKSNVARDVDALLKYRNNGSYPDYYGGVYISDDAYYLILQIVKSKIPQEGTREYFNYYELITLNDYIKIEYVDNSYNDLEDIYNKINEYFDKNGTFDDINAWGIDIMNNCVMVNIFEVNEEKINYFRDNILNTDMIRFEDNVDNSKQCTNFLEEIGDDVVDLGNKKLLINIEEDATEYIPVSLSLYDDGTYELFTAYESCRPGRLCTLMLKYTKSVKGTYNYDVKKIIDASTSSDGFNWNYKNKPKYRIYLGEKYMDEYNNYEYIVEKNKINKYLKELLNEINVDLEKCAKPEYND